MTSEPTLTAGTTTPSAAWKAFVASSFVNNNNASNNGKSATSFLPHQKGDAFSGGSLFGLQQALSSSASLSNKSSPNTSAVANNKNDTQSPSKLPSFFIANKSDLFLVGGTQHQQQQKTHHHTSVTRMRDIALKHLFQPELITTSATTMESFLPSSLFVGKNGGDETRFVSSFGITPLKTAPLRLGVRKRLGVALLNQKGTQSSSSAARSRTTSSSPDNQNLRDDENDEEETEQDQNEKEDYNIRLLRHLGNKILRKRGDDEKKADHQNQQQPTASPLPTSKSNQKSSTVKTGSTIAGDDEVSRKQSHYDEKNDEEEKILQRHIEDAANRARSMSYSQLYEESIKREREQQQLQKNDPDGDFQTKLKRLQQEQEELERRKMYDEEDAYEIHGRPKQQERTREQKSDTSSTTRNRTQERLFSQDVDSAKTKSAEENHDDRRHNDDATSAVERRQAVEKTGDFKTPLKLARQTLQSCYQSLEEEHGIPASQVAHHVAATTTITMTKNNSNSKSTTTMQAKQAASTVHYLQGKMDALFSVANRIEKEEHKMRLATATILAEILSLKNLEAAAKSEALSWVEYGQDVREEEEEHDETENVSRLLEAEEVEAAARDFLIDLE